MSHPKAPQNPDATDLAELIRAKLHGDNARDDQRPTTTPTGASTPGRRAGKVARPGREQRTNRQYAFRRS